MTVADGGDVEASGKAESWPLASVAGWLVLPCGDRNTGGPGLVCIAGRGEGEKEEIIKFELRERHVRGQEVGLGRGALREELSGRSVVALLSKHQTCSQREEAACRHSPAGPAEAAAPEEVSCSAPASQRPLQPPADLENPEPASV